ncbi:MAG TPA: VapE domain-containing protein [Gaiellaceae bacterium]|nr:VapE domain-containing protein [Gaiellaceae bacterium]
MTDEEVLRKFIALTDQPPVVVARSESTLAERIGDKKLVIIGTSGSNDYLRDGTGDRRFWPVTVPANVPARTDTPDDGQTCDGLRDEDAPVQYLCLRCFPYGEIPPSDEDEYGQTDRDDHEEME